MNIFGDYIVFRITEFCQCAYFNDSTAGKKRVWSVETQKSKYIFFRTKI